MRVQQLVPEEDSPDAKDIPLPAELKIEVRKRLDVMLGRPIIDFLVRYFVAKVNWLVSLIPFPLPHFQLPNPILENLRLTTPGAATG